MSSYFNADLSIVMIECISDIVSVAAVINNSHVGSNLWFINNSLSVCIDADDWKIRGGKDLGITKSKDGDTDQQQQGSGSNHGKQNYS